MSVAQDEIAAQIESIKAEWQQTVQGFESTADAPSGLSRSDFKEVAHARGPFSVSQARLPPRSRGRTAGPLTGGDVCAVEAAEAAEGKVPPGTP